MEAEDIVAGVIMYEDSPRVQPIEVVIIRYRNKREELKFYFH